MTINTEHWVPACGETEKPFEINGYRLLYMWNKHTAEHAYLNLGTDIFLTDEEVTEIFP